MLRCRGRDVLMQRIAESPDSAALGDRAWHSHRRRPRAHEVERQGVQRRSMARGQRHWRGQRRAARLGRQVAPEREGRCECTGEVFLLEEPEPS